MSETNRPGAPRRAKLVAWMVVVIYAGMLILSTPLVAAVKVFGVPMQTIETYNEPLTWVFRLCLVGVLWLGARRASAFGPEMSAIAVWTGAIGGLVVGALLWSGAGEAATSQVASLTKFDGSFVPKLVKLVAWMSCYIVGILLGSLVTVRRRATV